MTLSYCFNIYITFMGNLCVWEREKGGGGEIGSREGVYTSIREGVSEIVNVIVSERK